MNREEFIRICNKKEKLVRTEYEFSQEKMADVLGISKKTLVDIEKGRRSLGWTGSVALCSIFSGSEVLAGTFGGVTEDMVQAIAFAGIEKVYRQTMGGNVWWKEMDRKDGYKIQQNLISKHYRILDCENRRICSSFDYEEIKACLQDLQRNEV